MKLLHVFLRPLLIIVPMAVGWFLPVASKLYVCIPWLIIFMLFTACLQMRFRDLKPEWWHLQVFVCNLLMGIIPFFIFKFLGLTTLSLAGFFTGIAPTATAAPVMISFLGGRVGPVVTGFIMTNIGITLCLLGLIPLVTGNFTLSFFLTVLWNLCLLIFLPAGLSLLLRKIHPASVDWPKKIRNFSFCLWSFVLFLIAAKARVNFDASPDMSGLHLLAVIGLSAAICFLNFFTGSLLGPKSRHRECSQMLGQKNTTFTIYLALTFGNPVAAMGPISYVLWHNAWNAVQIYFYDRHQLKKQNLREEEK